MRIEIVHKHGESFQGVSNYLLHDKAANTNERVAFTETVGLATNDPDKAWRAMAATAMDAPRLKAQAGVGPQGRKAKGGPVMHVYLSWRPDEVEHLTPEVMTREARGALAKLGKDTTHSKKVKNGYRFYGDECQALIVGHSDTANPHVHIVVNRVHPTHGRMLPDSNDHLKLSKYADKFEERNGKLVTPQRRLNNEARARGEYVKHDKKKSRAQYEAEQAVSDKAAARKAGLLVEQTRRAALISQKQRKAAAANKLAMQRIEAARKERAGAIVIEHRKRASRIVQSRRRRTGEGLQAIREAYRPLHEEQLHQLQAKMGSFQAKEERAVGRAINALRAIDFGALVGYSTAHDDGRAATFREAFGVFASRGAREQAIHRQHERDQAELVKEQKAKETSVRSREKSLAEAAELLRRAEQRSQEVENRRRFASERQTQLERNARNEAILKRAWRRHDQAVRHEWRELAREHPSENKRGVVPPAGTKSTQPGDLVGPGDTKNAAHLVDAEKQRRERMQQQIEDVSRGRDDEERDR